MPSKLPHYALRIPTSIMDKLKYIADTTVAPPIRKLNSLSLPILLILNVRMARLI